MKNALLFLLLFGLIQFTYARPPKGYKKSKNHVTFRADCQPGESHMDLDINNVRARLLSRGDMWWDYNDAVYEVPKDGGVSSIFAGALWVGGYDVSGNLKLSVADFSNNGETDYYPGPLNPLTGETDPAICQNWDKHFGVYGSEIDQFLLDWSAAQQSGNQIADDLIPDNMKAYPARGNPYFTSMPNGFVLPDQELAPFFDNNMDGIYNPKDGDYPILGIRGCDNMKYADQMVFQIFNDNGGAHASGGTPIRLEFQAQSFAFSTDDEINDMTFYRYKIINRSLDTLNQAYFSLWMDGDLGCSTDDYVGCDTLRSLVYNYNSDAVDGPCSSTDTYGKKIPILGIDIFQGPLDENGVELKMSSFIYFNRAGTTPAPSIGTTDPGMAVEYYNYMTGLWKDGTPLYAGGDGYQDTQYPITKFAYYDAPNDTLGWSMAQEDALDGDRRTVQSVGPFTMNPGATNEIAYGLPWVPAVLHPAPSLATLLAADDKAQAIFDDCFTNVVATDMPKQIELSIFPNPTSDIIHIQSSENRVNVQFQLISMSGQVVLSQKVDSNVDISIRHLPQGVYGYQVMDLKGELLAVGQIVKE